MTFGTAILIGLAVGVGLMLFEVALALLGLLVLAAGGVALVAIRAALWLFGKALVPFAWIAGRAAGHAYALGKRG